MILPFPGSTNIQQLKEKLSTEITPTKPPLELTITCRGKIIEDRLKSIKDVIGSSSDGQPVKIMLSSKSAIEMEYVDANEAATGGSFNPSGDKVDPVLLKSAIEQLKEFLGGSQASDEIIGLALKKCELNVEEAILYVISDEKIADL